MPLGLRVSLVAVLLAVARPAAAEEHPRLARARAEIENVRFDRAVEILRETLESGTLTAGDAASVHQLFAEASIGLGDADAGEEHYAIALTLAPDITLQEFASPKIVEVFERARERVGGQKLSLSQTADGQTGTLTLRIESDPMQLVAAAVVAYRMSDGSERSLQKEGTGTIEVALPAEAKRGVSLYAVDRYGNRLAGFYIGDLARPQRQAAAPPPPPPTPGDESPRDGGGSVITSWWLWAGVSGAFLASGVTFGILAESKQDELDRIRKRSGEHFFSEAKQAEDAARSRALVANISFAVAGAAGIAAATFFFLDGGETRVALTPTSDGGSATVRFAF